MPEHPPASTYTRNAFPCLASSVCSALICFVAFSVSVIMLFSAKLHPNCSKPVTRCQTRRTHWRSLNHHRTVPHHPREITADVPACAVVEQFGPLRPQFLGGVKHNVSGCNPAHRYFHVAHVVH